MRKLCLITFLMSGSCFLSLTLTANAQEPPTVCISQNAANKAAELARENPALQAKIAVLEQALIDKDASIKELRDTAGKNESDLKEALKQTEVKLALEVGKNIQLNADRVLWAAVVEVLIKNSRAKKNGLINF